MQEIKNNKTALKVFINGVPDFKLISKEKIDSTVSVLELKFTEYYKTKKVKKI